MKQLRSEISSGNQETSDIDDLIQQLNAGSLLTPWVSSTPNKTEAAIPAEIRLPEEQWHLVSPLLRSGQKAYWIRIGLSEQCEMTAARFHMIDIWLTDLAFVLWMESVRPAEADSESRNTSARWLLVSKVPQEKLEATIIEWMDVDRVEISECGMTEMEGLYNSFMDDSPISSQTDSQSSPPLALQEKSRVQSIRVNVDRLERMMNLVGELVIDQTRFKQIEKSLDTKFGADELVQDLGQISDHFTRIIGELQESVMKVRMLPIEQLFNRFPRMIRDISQALGKDVELIMEGKETELDRTLIEEIGDPFIHLLRNAVDHGIELPEQRRESGKPAKGKVLIRASHEDNQVLIVVEDDGAGIDSQKLLQKALSLKIISPVEAEQYTEKEAVDLIFHPGLSTASEVSDISGRGVGMDIVRASIEKMNGRIDIDTVKSQGTRFKIRLPLTLAIITGLLVKVSEHTFIIPMSNVAEIVRLSTAEIRNVKGIPIVTIRDQVIPIVWLHDCFGYSRRTEHSKHIPVVIIGRAEKRYALAVDELLGNQEIVIKSLGAFIGQTNGIAGATILGNGKVALILEIGGIIRMMVNA